MYMYETCIGSLYATKEELGYEDLHCNICNDSDVFIGFANDKEEAIGTLLRYADFCDSKFDKDFLDAFVGEYFVR